MDISHLAKLRDKDPAKRCEALIEMANIEIGEDANEIVQIMLHDPDKDVRAEAAETLCRIWDKRPGMALMNGLNDKDERVRLLSAAALSWFQHERVEITLETVLTDSD